jgi:nitrogen fixation protein FixH
VSRGSTVAIATVWIGSRVREDTVVPNPYEEGLRLTEERVADRCDLSSRPCTLRLPGSGEVTLEIAPRPPRTMRELQVRAVLRDPAGARGSDEVAVAFTMPGMEMGRNEVRLAPQDGVFVGTAVLVRCPSGRKGWVAEVRVGRGEQVRGVRFPFTVEE